ncbi:hypothetical protein JZ751_015000, partial [Albula glossodonta]
MRKGSRVGERKRGGESGCRTSKKSSKQCKGGLLPHLGWEQERGPQTTCEKRLLLAQEEAHSEAGEKTPVRAARPSTEDVNVFLLFSLHSCDNAQLMCLPCRYRGVDSLRPADVLLAHGTEVCSSKTTTPPSTLLHRHHLQNSWSLASLK